MDRIELSLELCRVQTLASCLDDAIEKAILGNPSEEGDKAVSLVMLLIEHLEALIDRVDQPVEGVA